MASRKTQRRLERLALLMAVMLAVFSALAPFAESARAQDMAEASDDGAGYPVAPVSDPALPDSAPMAMEDEGELFEEAAQGDLEAQWEYLRAIGAPCQAPYVQIPCPELTGPKPSNPEQPRPSASSQPVISTGSVLCPPVREVQAKSGLLVKRKGTGVAGEACAFAHRAFPNAQPFTCFHGAICTVDVAGLGVRVYLGNGQHLNARAFTIRIIDAYGPQDAVRQPCVLVAKERAFGRDENPNFGVQIPHDAGYSCHGPLPDVKTSDAGTPGVIGVPTGPGCPDTAAAQAAIGVSVERESYVEACVFYWRGVPDYAEITCPAGWLCTMHLRQSGDPLKDRTHLAIGDGARYTVFGVTVRYKSAYPAGDAVHDDPPNWLRCKEKAFLNSDSGGVPHGNVLALNFASQPCPGEDGHSSASASSSAAPSASTTSTSSMGCASDLLSRSGWTDRGNGFWKYRGEKISFVVPSCAKKVDGDKGSYKPGDTVPPGVEFSLYL